MNGIADYTFIRSLGDGNHGEIFLATPPPRLALDSEFVAVKIWGRGTTETAFDKAVRELRLFSSLQSPYLVTLYDAGQDGDTFFYAMEYCPAGSLAAPRRPLTRAEVLQATAHGARAAHALHETGLVHRDIKPANILVTDSGGKLSDLGLARVMEPGMTVSGMSPIRSLEFVDPSLLRDARPSRASDIWSIGVTLHHVLSGVGVYGELPDHDPLLAVRTVLGHAPQLAATLADDERALVVACLDPDPTRRPATALEVAERIEGLS